jgi:hypothetical protein
VKEELIDSFFIQGRSLKETSQRLGINYSSAKSIIDNYRKRFKSRFFNGARAGWASCGVRPWEEETTPIVMVSSIGGSTTQQI